MLKHWAAALGLAALLGAAGSAAAGAQSKALSIELNRLEQDGAGCRFDLVIANRLEVAFSRFSTDLVFFDAEGVITTRASTHFGRLRPRKTHLRSFVLSPFTCTSVDRVLLNDVIECGHDGGDGFDCLDAVEVSHRGTVTLVK
jgi:hypothetical protein